MAEVNADYIDEIGVDDSLVISANLLKMLRQNNELEEDHYGRFDDVFSQVEIDLKRVFEIFLSETDQLRFVDASEFSENGVSQSESQLSLIAELQNTESQFLFAVHMEVNAYRVILKGMLGVEQDGNPEQGQLTGAEEVLFLQITEYIGSMLRNALSINSNEKMTLKRTVAEELGAESAINELIIMTFELNTNNKNYPLLLIVPVELLELNDTSGESIKTDLLHDEYHGSWKGRLDKIIDTLPIPLSIEVASSEMLLTEVSQFSIGNRLGISFDMSDARIFDANGNSAFRADVEQSQQFTQLRIVETSGHIGD